MASQNGSPSSPRENNSFPENDKSTPGQEVTLRARHIYPGGDRSLSGIAMRAFLLGVCGAIGFIVAAALATLENRLWRPFFFLGILCVFHFLEFWTTAAYNTPVVRVDSFLLTNGSQYRQAHQCAFLETIITSYFFPEWQARNSQWWGIALGVVLIVIGQVVRSLAMVQAGTNFNHQVQTQKNAGHELVTTGLYSIFRHPSYFGFFWWGLGTQLAIGNTISFLGYAGALWYFFYRRIMHEEKKLIEFFGDDYKAYKARTRIWIPFI